MTELQSRLISLSHLYDIIQQSVSQHNSYGEDSETEIPEDIKPYPTKLSKWFEKWQDDNEKTRSANSRSDNKRPKGNKITRSRWVDDETDEEAYAAYRAGQRAKKVAGKE